MLMVTPGVTYKPQNPSRKSQTHILNTKTINQSQATMPLGNPNFNQRPMVTPTIKPQTMPNQPNHKFGALDEDPITRIPKLITQNPNPKEIVGLNLSAQNTPVCTSLNLHSQEVFF